MKYRVVAWYWTNTGPVIHAVECARLIEARRAFQSAQTIPGVQNVGLLGSLKTVTVVRQTWANPWSLGVAA